MKLERRCRHQGGVHDPMQSSRPLEFFHHLACRLSDRLETDISIRRTRQGQDKTCLSGSQLNATIHLMGDTGPFIPTTCRCLLYGNSNSRSLARLWSTYNTLIPCQPPKQKPSRAIMQPYATNQSSAHRLGTSFAHDMQNPASPILQRYQARLIPP